MARRRFANRYASNLPVETMPQFGSPFKSGTLSSAILMLVVAIYFSYAWFENPDRRFIALILLFISLVNLARTYFKYRRSALHEGIELVGDEE